MTTIDAEKQMLNPSALVDLFCIDFLPTGLNTQIYFTNSSSLGYSLTFDGKEYIPRGIQVEGFSRSGQDAPPTPTLSITNVDKGGNALLETYDDMLGAKLTRIRTHARYLDKDPMTGLPNPTANPSAKYIPEIWYIEQKTDDTPLIVAWEMKSILDLYGKQIPARNVYKSYCKRVYRIWDSSIGAFVYSQVNACPYTGGAYYKRDNTTTGNPAEDECNKDLPACHVRFGSAPMPAWFFPGAQRYSR